MGLWDAFVKMGSAITGTVKQIPLGSIVKEIPQTLGSIATKAIPQILTGNYLGAITDSYKVIKDKYGGRIEQEASNLIKRAGNEIVNIVEDEVRKKRHYEI